MVNWNGNQNPYPPALFPVPSREADALHGERGVIQCFWKSLSVYGEGFREGL
jgi:hypothetical protein